MRTIKNSEVSWVNLNGFEQNKAKRQQIRKAYGWSDGDVVVISLRSHKPIYGVEYLIDVISQVLAKNKHVKFLILGEGPLTDVFKAKMATFIKSVHVKFAGAVPHNKVVDYLSAADIYVSTSFSEKLAEKILLLADKHKLRRNLEETAMETVKNA